MQVTKELLEKTQQELLEVWRPFVEAHKKDRERVFKPLTDLLEQYYDSKLFDSNGDIVKGTMVIKKGKKRYAITGRNMQFMCGSFLMNPHVFAKPLTPNDEIDHSKKEIEISPSELVEYTIIKDFYEKV